MSYYPSLEAIRARTLARSFASLPQPAAQSFGSSYVASMPAPLPVPQRTTPPPSFNPQPAASASSLRDVGRHNVNASSHLWHSQPAAYPKHDNPQGSHFAFSSRDREWSGHASQPERKKHSLATSGGPESEYSEYIEPVDRLQRKLRAIAQHNAEMEMRLSRIAAPQQRQEQAESAGRSGRASRGAVRTVAVCACAAPPLTAARQDALEDALFAGAAVRTPSFVLPVQPPLPRQLCF
jgi:hypothetical protein